MEATATNTELAVITEKSGLEKKTTDEIAKKFSQFFTTAKQWKQKIEGLQITSVEQKAEMKMARDARLFLKNTRIVAEKEKDSMRLVIKEKTAKYVAEDKFVVECFRLVETAFKNIEKIAQDKEDFAEKLEQERKDKLKAERIEILTPLSEFVPMGLNLADMSEDDFSKLVNGANLQKEAKEQADKKAELEAIERENAVKLYNARKQLLIPYWSFLKVDQASIDFSALPQESFDIIHAEVVEAKKEYDLEKENQRLEIERLKKENEEKLKVRINRNGELKPYIIFIRDYNKMLDLNEEDYQKEFLEIQRAAKEHYEYEAKENLKKQEVLELQLKEKAKKDAEEEAKLKEEARLEAELNKGDAAKFNDLIADLTLITTKYNFKAKKNQKIYADVVNLVNKTIDYANSKKI